MTSTPVPELRHHLRREGLSFLDSAPVVVEAEVEIEATPDRIWPLIADAEAWAHWFPGVSRSLYTSAPPHRVGSTRFVQVNGLKVNEEVIAFEPGHRFAFCVTDANVPAFAALVEQVTLEPVGDAETRVRYRQALALRRPVRPAGRALAPMLRSALGRGLRGLRKQIAAIGDRGD
jgi:uncharacterized protein YndB with AHSA1/START domain